MRELMLTQQIRLEAAKLLLTSRDGDLDVWEVLELAHTIEFGEVKGRDEFIEEKKSSSK